VFALPWLPHFPKLRRELLALQAAPELALPDELSRGLERVATPDPDALARVRGRGELALWRSSLSSVSRLMGLAAIASVLAAGLATLSALVGMELLKGSRPLAQLVLLCLCFFALNIASQCATFASDRLRLYVSLGAETHLVGLIAGKLLRMSPRRRSRHSSGNLKILITSDVRNVGVFLDNFVRNLIPSVAALLVITPVLLHFAGAAGLAGIGFMGLLLPVSAVLTRWSTRYAEQTQRETDQLASLAGEWVKNVRLIRSLSWNDSFLSSISERVRAFTRVASWQHWMACLIFGMSLSWWMAAVAVVAWLSRMSGHRIDVVPFFGSIWLITYLSNYFTHLPNTIRLYAEAKPSVSRIARVLAEEEQADAFARPLVPVVVAGLAPLRVRFDEVCYRPDAGSPEILGPFTGTIELSEKLAVLGEIGSGKTTLLKLLCAEIPPTSGTITVEFSDGSRHDLWIEPVYHRLREAIAYVPQEAFVSNDSLESNVALDELPESPHVLQALAFAELESDVALLKSGLKQEIGESGVNLSGGQKQRLNLARAFHSGRPYLVLDDTLSAVDPRTERLLVDRLTGRSGGFVLVTHRLGEIARMDRVWVMKEGRLVEAGSPAELARRPDSHFTRVLGAYE
jgi:ABC-type multidrug transport system fused ATPase/permease subunit